MAGRRDSQTFPIPRLPSQGRRSPSDHYPLVASRSGRGGRSVADHDVDACLVSARRGRSEPCRLADDLGAIGLGAAVHVCMRGRKPTPLRHDNGRHHRCMWFAKRIRHCGMGVMISSLSHPSYRPSHLDQGRRGSTQCSIQFLFHSREWGRERGYS